MAMILAVDAIAKRYSLLPSEVMERASTFDLVILDTSLTYQRYAEDKASGKKTTPELSVDQMKEMLAKVRNGNKNTT